MVLHVMEESKCIVYFLCARTKGSCGHRPDRRVLNVTLTKYCTQENTFERPSGNYD